MSLENTTTIDAIGIDNATGYVVPTLADSCDWTNEHGHLLALQAKLNAYFEFIESGQIIQAYPIAQGRRLVIDVVTRYSLPMIGIELLQKAQTAVNELEVVVRHKCVPGTR